jgi:genome maintenance exonuclease 1
MRKVIYEGPKFPKLETHNIAGLRWYEVPSGDKYPSITSVLGKQPDKIEGLKKWRERIGDVQANVVSRRAASRGTSFHHMCEDYLVEEIFDEEKHKSKNFLAWAMFGQVKKTIDERVGDIFLMEQAMYSTKYKVAGRVDLIAMFDGVPTIIDWKTSTTMKKDEWNTDYYTQCSAYADMYTEHTGELIEDLAIIMVSEDGEVEVFKKKVGDYKDRLDTIMEEFYTNVSDLLENAA